MTRPWTDTMDTTSIKEIEINGVPLKLYTSERVFEPNLTTRTLAECVVIPPGSRVLDLGCGVGPLAIYAALKGAREVYAVDVMAEACAYARRNVELNGVADRVKVVQSNLFENLPDEKFDVIIDDVSGMSDKISRISPWYPDSIPTGGHDGTGPTIQMLTEVRNHLTENGQLYFPVLSLADSNKILAKARELFSNGVEAVAKKWIPFCDEFKAAMREMEVLKQEGVIDYISRRSRYLWSLEIYRVTA